MKKSLIRSFLVFVVVGGLGGYWYSSLTPSYALEQSILESKKLSDIAEPAVKSVVNISSVKIIRYRSTQFSPFFNDPFFRHFFGQQGIPRERRERSLGSGVIISRKGYILTNNHVVSNAFEVTILFHDRTEQKAKIIGTDPQTDIALLQVQLPKGIVPLRLGNSDTLRLAETVLAIGSPFGFGGSVTKGIVSAKGRANLGIVDYEDFIQTDAAINPGNSGGALINLKGELIGINTAIYSRNGGYQGISFAIPINMARKVMKKLIQYGKVVRGWIGLQYQNVSAEIAKALKLKKLQGALVTGVFKLSPADKAGLKPGDVIVAFENQNVRDAGNLSKFLSETDIGQNVKLRVKRDRKEFTATVKIEARPKQMSSRRRRAR